MKEKSSVLERYASNLDGNIAVTFALAMLGALVTAGSAYDYARISELRTSAQTAADSAALAATNSATAAINSGKSDWQSAGLDEAEKYFSHNFNPPAGTSPPAPEISFVRNLNSVKTTFTYATSIPTSFLGIFGVRSLPMKVSSTSSTSLPNYVDIHLLVDVSSSMGIGATPADQTKIHDLTGCALACHYNATAAEKASYAAVRSSGARTRLDVVRDSMIEFIKKSKLNDSTGDQIRISIDFISSDLIRYLAPTTNLNDALDAAADIDLTDKNMQGGTNVRRSLQQFNAAYPASGDGYSSSRRKSFVVLLGDGVEDSATVTWLNKSKTSYTIFSFPEFPIIEPSYFDGYRVQPFGPDACTATKTNGHTILTAQIQYLMPMYASSGYKPRLTAIQDMAPDVKKSFQACASVPEDNYFAHESAEITPMFDNILSSIFARRPLRLTD